MEILLVTAFARGTTIALIALSFAHAGLAQDETPAHPGVKLQFIPPPMEGTISLGVYDAKGKLVRVLKREASTEDFTVALNGLITFWDGKDDSGTVMTAGKYSAHGFVVGELETEGEAFDGNDWVKDEDSPRIQRITELFAMPGGGFGISARDSEGKISLAAFDASGEPSQTTGGMPRKIVVREGKVLRIRDKAEETLPLVGVEHPVAACFGRADDVWVIDALPGGMEVKEFSVTGEFQRRLAIASGEPAPRQVAASTMSDQLFLLEESPRLQRVRSLGLVPPTSTPGGNAGSTSTWKVIFEKTIWFSDTLEQVRDRLKRPDGKPFVPQEKVTIALRQNPLDRDKPGKAEVSIALGADGSFLRLTDGLPLTYLTGTPHLKWAALARGSDGSQLTLFQSDGAVIEQFRVSKPGEMMAFDCGDFDFDPKNLK